MFNRQDIDTILAALRHYQQCGLGDPEKRSDEIHAVATDGGETSLDDAGIDALCDKLNGEAVSRYTFYQWRDEWGLWRSYRDWPSYDFNNGTTGGLPRQINRLYEEQEPAIKRALYPNQPALQAGQGDLFL